VLSPILEKCLAHVPSSKFRRWAVLERPVGAKLADAAGSGLALELREVMPPQVALLKGVNAYCDDNAAPCRRFQKGNRCFIAELCGEPVFYAWVLFNDTESPLYLPARADMHVHVILLPYWAYLWDTWTKENCRGRGIQPSAIELLSPLLGERGCKGLMALVNVNNRSSMRAFAKSKFTQQRVLTHLRLFGCDLVLGTYAPREKNDL